MITPLKVFQQDHDGLFIWKVDVNEDMYKHYYVNYSNIPESELKQEVFEYKLIDQDYEDYGKNGYSGFEEGGD